MYLSTYRDGGTVGVGIKGKKGNHSIDFFFDRFLGRLCYGKDETKFDAAYIKRGSKFEKEVYSYLQTARKRLNPDKCHPAILNIELFDKCFQKAKVYSGYTNTNT